MIPKAVIGGLLLSLALSACSSRPPLVQACPKIPVALTEPCRVDFRELATNADLARAFLDAHYCLREDELKLRSIRELADCRLEPAK